MNVTITTRHLNNRKKSNQLRSYALKKIQKINKYIYDHKEPSEIKLILEKQKLRNTAEILVTTGNLQATASVETEEMHEAIDRLVDTIVKQLRRKSEKKITTKRRVRSLDAKENIFLNEKIKGKKNNIQVEQLPLKPMSVEEALLQAEVSKNGFVVFRNSQSGEMNVIYHKRNTNYGLITP